MSEKWFLNKVTGVVDHAPENVVDEITKRDPVKFEEIMENDPRTKPAKEQIEKTEAKVEVDKKIASAPTPADREIAKAKAK